MRATAYAVAVRARLLPCLFWAALLATFALCLMPAPDQPPLPVSDKIQHLAAFAALTGLGAAAYPGMSPLRLGLGLAAFGAVTEMAQTIPGLNRHGSLADWLADLAGIAIVLAALILARRVRKA